MFEWLITEGQLELGRSVEIVIQPPHPPSEHNLPGMRGSADRLDRCVAGSDFRAYCGEGGGVLNATCWELRGVEDTESQMLVVDGGIVTENEHGTCAEKTKQGLLNHGGLDGSC